MMKSFIIFLIFTLGLLNAMRLHGHEAKIMKGKEIFAHEQAQAHETSGKTEKNTSLDDIETKSKEHVAKGENTKDMIIDEEEEHSKPVKDIKGKKEDIDSTKDNSVAINNTKKDVSSDDFATTSKEHDAKEEKKKDININDNPNNSNKTVSSDEKNKEKTKEIIKEEMNSTDDNLSPKVK